MQDYSLRESAIWVKYVLGWSKDQQLEKIDRNLLVEGDQWLLGTRTSNLHSDLTSWLWVEVVIKLIRKISSVRGLEIDNEDLLAQ